MGRRSRVKKKKRANLIRRVFLPTQYRKVQYVNEGVPELMHENKSDTAGDRTGDLIR